MIYHLMNRMVLKSNVNHVSSNACASPGQCSSSSIIYNACNIKTFLKEQPEKYVVVVNHKVNHVKPSPCCRVLHRDFFGI
jgi:hypothetical protein